MSCQAYNCHQLIVFSFNSQAPVLSAKTGCRFLTAFAVIWKRTIQSDGLAGRRTRTAKWSLWKRPEGWGNVMSVNRSLKLLFLYTSSWSSLSIPYIFYNVILLFFSETFFTTWSGTFWRLPEEHPFWSICSLHIGSTRSMQTTSRILKKVFSFSFFLF